MQRYLAGVSAEAAAPPAAALDAEALHASAPQQPLLDTGMPGVLEAPVDTAGTDSALSGASA